MGRRPFPVRLFHPRLLAGFDRHFHLSRFPSQRPVISQGVDRTHLAAQSVVEVPGRVGRVAGLTAAGVGHLHLAIQGIVAA